MEKKIIATLVCGLVILASQTAFSQERRPVDHPEKIVRVKRPLVKVNATDGNKKQPVIIKKEVDSKKVIHRVKVKNAAKPRQRFRQPIQPRK